MPAKFLKRIALAIAPLSFCVSAVMGETFSLQQGVELTGSQSFNRTHFADYDHDGLVDLVAHDSVRQKIYVFRQTSAKTLESSPSLSIPNVSSSFSEVADFNGDGFGDLVYQSGTEVHILVSSPTGFLATSSITLDHAQHYLTATGDFDGDGNVDLYFPPDVSEVLSTMVRPKPHIYWGAGNGQLETSASYLPKLDGHRTVYYRFIQTADMDANGAKDVIAYAGFGRVVLKWDANRDIDVSYLDYDHEMLHDMDGDGRADKVKFRLYDGSDFSPAVVIRKQNTDGSFGAEIVSNVTLDQNDYSGYPDEDLITPADLDGDGNAELILINLNLREAIIVQNTGNATFSPHLTSVTFPEAILDIAVQDMDMDGQAEIVASGAFLLVSDALGRTNPLHGHASSASISWSRSFGYSVASTIGYTARPRVIKPLDVDRDGLDDLLYLEGSNPGVTWLKKISAGSLDFQRELTVSLPGLQGNDFVSFEGLPDYSFKILAATSGRLHGQVEYDNKTSYLTESELIDPIFSTNRTIDQVNWNKVHGLVKNADVDHDSNPDFITANPLNGDLIWYEYHKQTQTWSTPVKIDSPTQSAEVSPVTTHYRRLVTVVDTDDDGFDEIYYVLSHKRKEIHRAEYNPTTASFDLSLSYTNPGGSSIERLQHGDIDQDGDEDLFWIQRLSGPGGEPFLYWMQNNSGQLANPASLTEMPFGMIEYAVVDMDLDGFADIVSIEGAASDVLGNPYGRRTISWLRQRSAGVFDPAVVIAKTLGPGDDMLIKDMNGDGRPDIVHASAVSASLELFINEPSDTPPDYPTWLAEHAITSEDEDGDAFKNIEEYYYVLNPSTQQFSGDVGTPRVTITTHGTNPTSAFKVEVDRRKGIDPTRWSLVLETSSDMENWTPTFVPPTVCWNPAKHNKEQVSWRIHQSNDRPFFVRLKLTRQDP